MRIVESGLKSSLSSNNSLLPLTLPRNGFLLMRKKPYCKRVLWKVMDIENIE